MEAISMTTATDTTRRDATAAGTDFPWRELALSMTCGIVAAGTDGRLLFVNPPARRILGLATHRVEGAPATEILGEHPALRQVLLEAQGLHTLPNRAETEVRTPDGHRRTLGFTATVLRDPAGTPFGSAIFFKDLTRIEQAEEQERLRDRLAALGQMAAGMAHEIRNPLASIQVTAGLLRRKLAAEDDAVRLIDKIHHEVQRMDRTLVDCLDYVKPLTPRIEFEAIETVVEEAIEQIRTEFPDAGVRFVTGTGDELPELRIDRHLLLQVFQNLLRNAVEAQEGRGEVRVGTAREESGADLAGDEGGAGMIEVSIADNGPGIAEELHEKLFYPFFTTKKSGSGLGLAEVRKIVEIHGGLVDLESEPGRGTTFRLRFPIPEESS